MVFVATSHESDKYLPSAGFYFYDFLLFSNIGKNLFVFCVQNQKDISPAIRFGKIGGWGESGGWGRIAQAANCHV